MYTKKCTCSRVFSRDARLSSGTRAVAVHIPPALPWSLGAPGAEVKKISKKSVHPAVRRYNLKVGGDGASLKMQEKKGENCMIYSKSSNTKRFQFGVSQNNTAKKAGSNVLTISTRAYDNDFYSTPTTQLSMTIKEARSLQSFLNSALPIDNVE